jgi:hypothetical protein
MKWIYELGRPTLTQKNTVHMDLKEIEFKSELNSTDSCLGKVVIYCERDNEQKANIKERSDYKFPKKDSAPCN